MQDARLSPSETISSSLIQRLQLGDEAAWQRLLQLYAPLVFYWCRGAGLAPQDAADVVQDVFQAVHRSLPGFRRSQPSDTFRGWLRAIAKNKIRDHYRAQTHQPTALGGTDAQLRFLDLAAEESEGSEGFDAFAALVHRALSHVEAEFELRTWKAFWLSAVGQQSATEVAERLGMTAGAVRQAKYRVLRRLRQELGDAD